MDNGTLAREDRDKPGTATYSNAPIACATGALVLLAGALLVLFNDSPKTLDLLGKTSGWVVLIIWGVCSVGLGLIAFWAATVKHNTANSFSDVAPIGVVGGAVFAAAVLSSLLFGI